MWAISSECVKENLLNWQWQIPKSPSSKETVFSLVSVHVCPRNSWVRCYSCTASARALEDNLNPAWRLGLINSVSPVRGGTWTWTTYVLGECFSHWLLHKVWWGKKVVKWQKELCHYFKGNKWDLLCSQKNDCELVPLEVVFQLWIWSEDSGELPTKALHFFPGSLSATYCSSLLSMQSALNPTLST